jgi:hypothetical protein
MEVQRISTPIPLFSSILPEKSEFSTNGEKKKDGTWEMPLLRFELGKEVHVGYENSKSFYKIEPNGDLTEIANIVDGEREEVPRVQTTFTKIK